MAILVVHGCRRRLAREGRHGTSQGTHKRRSPTTNSTRQSGPNDTGKCHPMMTIIVMVVVVVLAGVVVIVVVGWVLVVVHGVCFVRVVSKNNNGMRCGGRARLRAKRDTNLYPTVAMYGWYGTIATLPNPGN